MHMLSLLVPKKIIPIASIMLSLQLFVEKYEENYKDYNTIISKEGKELLKKISNLELVKINSINFVTCHKNHILKKMLRFLTI